MDQNVVVGWIDGFIAAWNNHDAQSIVSFMADDAEFHHWAGTDWGVYSGREAIVEFIDWLNTDWSSDYSLRMTFAIESQQGFAIEYVEAGTVDLGEHASGREFRLRSAFVGELANGKISRITDYADMAAYELQTSVTTEPPA